MGPILAVAEAGYGFQDLMKAAKRYEEKFNVTSKTYYRQNSAKIFILK